MLHARPYNASSFLSSPLSFRVWDLAGAVSPAEHDHLEGIHPLCKSRVRDQVKRDENDRDKTTNLHVMRRQTVLSLSRQAKGSPEDFEISRTLAISTETASEVHNASLASRSGTPITNEGNPRLTINWVLSTKAKIFYHLPSAKERQRDCSKGVRSPCQHKSTSVRQSEKRRYNL